MTEAIKIILALQQAPGMKRKQAIISENKNNNEFLWMLCDLLNPRVTFKVSERTLRRGMEAPSVPYRFIGFQAVCAYLRRKKALNAETISQVCSFLRDVQDDDEREVYIKVLSKTLRLGVTAKTVNSTLGVKIIPSWEIQQAYPIDNYPIPDGVPFTITQKLNGVRATFYDGAMLARSGSQYDGLEHIISSVPEEFLDFVLDGELTIRHGPEVSDNEAFRIATGLVNSEDDDKTAICFTVFDCLPRDEFAFRGESSLTYFQRRSQYLDRLRELLGDCPYISVLPVLYQGTDQSVIGPLLERMVREDKEGLVANLDTTYKCRRHSGILKIKRFYTMDLPIIGFEEGNGRLSGTLGAVVVDFQGTNVRVGSGFTDSSRDAIWKNRENLIGTLCEVRYKEMSGNKKNDSKSLQFPSFVCLRSDKEDVSYG